MFIKLEAKCKNDFSNNKDSAERRLTVREDFYLLINY